MSMPTCLTCVYAKGICKKTGVEIRTTTGCTYHTPKPITNADRIRAMTDEELAAFLCNQQDVTGCSGCVAIDFCHYGHNGMIDWLKQIEVHGTDEGGGIRYDECGNVIDYGIVGPPGEPGVKEEATDGK